MEEYEGHQHAGDSMGIPPILLDLETLTEYANLDARRQELDREAREIAAKLAALEPALLDTMASAGVASVKVAGRTVYMDTRIWAQVVAGEGEDPAQAKARACQALKDSGHGDLVAESFNHQTLSAVMREMNRDGQDLPLEWEGALRPNEVVKLRTRKAGR